MKRESEALLRPVSSEVEFPIKAWLLPLGLVIGASVWLLAWFGETTYSIIGTWMRSETFAHGFLIVPISLWMIWTRRHTLATLRPEPKLWPSLLSAGCGFAWLVGELAGVIVVQQYALFLMLPLLVWTVLGRDVAWALAFPLFFLVFAVPFGEFLLTPLMNYTADFTVVALKLTGIPVFREGLFFTIPSGNWSVVEACSGLRYLIASLTLGCLYAYLTYRSLTRRVLFILLSIGVPILANGIRSYMIVMIGHLSDMRLATGVDHYIYGWVFFGGVMLLLFWLGSFWREDTTFLAQTSAVARVTSVGPPAAFPLLGIAAATFLFVSVATLWPAYAAFLVAEDGHGRPVVLALPTSDAWRAEEERISSWTPNYLNAAAEVHQVYSKDRRKAAVYIGYYHQQRQGAELITSQNVLVTSGNKVWASVGETSYGVPLGARSAEVRQTLLRSADTRLVAWHWYWIEGYYTDNPYFAKVLLATSKLLGKGDDSAVIVIYAPYRERPEEAVSLLEEFLVDMIPSIEKSLVNANPS